MTDAESWASEESVGSDAIVASSCGGTCGGDWDGDAPGEEGVSMQDRRSGLPSTLDFCAANFEIRHTRVFQI